MSTRRTAHALTNEARDPGTLLLAGILIGGRSRRMGVPKHLLHVGGRTILDHLVVVLRPHVARVVILGSGDVPRACRDLDRLEDVQGLRGPLAGMLAAMRWAPTATWLMVAGDLPLLRGEALVWLLEQRQSGRSAVLPQTAPSRVEPLLAVYEPRSAVLLERLVAQGEPAPRHLARFREVFTPTPPADLLPCWQNVNTPGDLARILEAGSH